MLLQRYRAIFRYAVGVAVLNPSGGGLFQRLFFVQTGFQEILYRDDLRLSKISVSLKCRGGGVASSWEWRSCSDTILLPGMQLG